MAAAGVVGTVPANGFSTQLTTLDTSRTPLSTDLRRRGDRRLQWLNWAVRAAIFGETIFGQAAARASASANTAPVGLLRRRSRVRQRLDRASGSCCRGRSPKSLFDLMCQFRLGDQDFGNFLRVGGFRVLRSSVSVGRGSGVFVGAATSVGRWTSGSLGVSVGLVVPTVPVLVWALHRRPRRPWLRRIDMWLFSGSV